MKFTWRTYFAAQLRSARLERLLHDEHMRCMRGPEAWMEQFRLTNRLIERERRERA